MVNDYQDEDLLMLSGIQHFAFCQRQWALIHIEQQWQENLLTFNGRDMHEHADDPFFTESRGAVLISRAVPLISRRLGLYGKADIVEFQRADQDGEKGVALPGHKGLWMPYPVEYKYGQSKEDDRDIVQLCAQALCLEEMLEVSVKTGALFYGRTRRRQTVVFDDELRLRVTGLAAQMHEMFQKGITPAPQYTHACDSCSLLEACMPKLKGNVDVVAEYMRKSVADGEGQRST
jgi:CRISPR-associated exonuclease Cas4